MSTDIIKRETITEMVNAYNSAVNSLKISIEEIEKATKIFESSYGGVFPFRMENSYHRWHNKMKDFSSIEKLLETFAWRRILEKTQTREIMTEKRRTEMEEQIEAGKMPEITVENIYKILENLLEKSKELATESIKEAFEILRPHYSEHKTNSEFEIGKKVILTRWISYPKYMKSFEIVYLSRQQIQVVDNAFHLLDGKGVAKYPHNLHTVIQKNLKKQTCETEYFKCTWFQAGTLHLEFKRLDLLAKLNQIGGGNRLRK